MEAGGGLPYKERFWINKNMFLRLFSLRTGMNEMQSIKTSFTTCVLHDRGIKQMLSK